MSSIEPSTSADLMVAELAERLVRLAGELRAGERTLFPTGRDASLESYFTVRTEREASKASFERPVVRDAAELEQKLAAMWAGGSAPELAALAPQFAALSDALRQLEATDGDALSPFLYAMF